MNLPASNAYLRTIRSAAEAATRTAAVRINDGAIARLLTSTAFTASFERVPVGHMAMPLQFPTKAHELGFFGLLSILNFGSGFEEELHRATGRGTFDKALAFSMYIADEDLMSARGMQGISETKIAELIGVNVHQERADASLPGVVIGELGGPMYELVKLVTLTLNETGEILVKGGYAHLGIFIARVLETAQGSLEVILEHVGCFQCPGRCADQLGKLVRTFPTFQDMAVVDGHPIFCFKKALLLIAVLVARNFVSVPSAGPPLPILADSVVPSLLVHLGVIDLSASHRLASVPLPVASADRLVATPVASASPVMASAGPVVSREEAYILRAAAIHAVGRMVEIAGEQGVEAVDLMLNQWLWKMAETDGYELGRFEFKLRGTVFL
ncbi:NAD+ kinase [Mycena chlorophos]|uniref:Queuosine 5'-phosphate N-glycosylase/hydrolase n=1 Tax=Mycena chlorophos TaxID=658473 RepID=A0A8H6VYA7_MYCCL|nr:NAD+ kinase [Mycena chlorophos]